MIMLARNHSVSIFIGAFLLCSQQAISQPIRIDESETTKKFPHVSLVFNRVFNSSGLDSFYQKLYLLKKNKQGLVTIVHIGDSHIQSDHLPGAVRKGFQDFFGEAGKGIDFPHELAMTGSRSSPKKDSTGVIYYAIGINGARFESFNRSSLFWQQLPGLKADLFIISLGTNDAQGNDFNDAQFQQQVTLLLEKLKTASPGAAILFTTAADSFKGGRPNRELWNLNISLFSYCTAGNIPVWDLYRTTNGFGSAYNWIKRGMMDGDGIHYTGEAYHLQGKLLFNALAKGYNNYINSY